MCIWVCFLHGVVDCDGDYDDNTEGPGRFVFGDDDGDDDVDDDDGDDDEDDDDDDD